MILDTNAVSAFADEQPGIFEALASASQLALPVVVIGEYRYGIAQSRRRRMYEQWLEEFVGSCRVLNLGETTARCYAEIRVELKKAGTPIPVNDAWIAALSREHELAIVSRDHHFDYVEGIRRVAW